MDGIAINYMVFGTNYTDEMWVSKKEDYFMNRLVLITDMTDDKKVYIFPTEDDQRDVIYKTLEKIKAFDGNLEKAAEELLNEQIKLDIISMPNVFRDSKQQQ